MLTHSLGDTFVDVMIDPGVRTDQVRVTAEHRTIAVTEHIDHGDATIDDTTATVMGCWSSATGPTNPRRQALP